MKFVSLIYLFMRQQLLFMITICASIIGFAQIPTAGLVKDYKFTNGAITSDINPSLYSGTATLLATGSNRAIVQDRNNETNKAITLNGDTFSAGGTNNQYVNSFAISFWLKTATNATDKSYIFDQFYQTNPCGWSVALQDGKIVFNAQSNLSVNSIYSYGQIAELISTNTVSDNSWHHVVCQAKTTTSNYYDGSFNHNTGTTVYELYIDNVLVTTTTKTLTGYFTISQVLRRTAIQANQNLLIGKSTNTANTGVFTNGIDQIRFYETGLTASEIEQLFIEDKPLTPVYVNINATGNNNGTSWNDAYTNLQTAITAATASINEIWVAAGTYKPTGTARTSTFTMKNAIKLYGGFNGTETELSQRNPKINICILSGDVNGNDNGTITATEATRQDNLYHVITARANIKDVTIDGFTISGGNANGGTLTTGAAVSQFYHTRGGAIYINPYTSGDNTTVFITNCILENNSATDTGVAAGYYAGGVNNQSFRLEFDSCIVRNNFSGTNSQILIAGASGYGWGGTSVIKNSLFHNNTSTSGASCLYLSASTVNSGTVLGINVNVINCTFSNNSGVNGNVIRTDNGANTYVKNSILYGNGSLTPINYTGLGGPGLTNTISEGGQISGINSNPLLNANFTLQVGSPAIDSGSNGLLVSGMSFDLNGNARIVGTNVDMGAYEYDAALSIESPNISNIFSVYPNPTNGLITIETNQEIKSVKLFSLDGKLLLEGQNSNLQIDNFPSGIYMLYLESVNGTTLYKKIIKN